MNSMPSSEDIMVIDDQQVRRVFQATQASPSPESWNVMGL